MVSTRAIDQLLQASSVHEEWRDILAHALQAVDVSYLEGLLDDASWLPGADQLFRAFQRDRRHCRFILFGESPYPRAQSANGIAFYDGAVEELWSDKGLSKSVNRATSLRNIIKSALLAEELIAPDDEGKITQPMIAALDKNGLIGSIHEFFDALQARGFLLFNATPVLHPDRKPNAEAKYWHGFIERLLAEIAASTEPLPTLVLWGKIAQQIEAIEAAQVFPKMISEHPYNISFITNKKMQPLFKQLKLLQSKP
jgi:uracil-DNA glycosylase